MSTAAAVKPLWPGIALATAGAIAFSGKAILAKLMYRHGVDAVQVLFWRMLLALPLFRALAWWAGRGKPAMKVATSFRFSCRADSSMKSQMSSSRSFAANAMPMPQPQAALPGPPTIRAPLPCPFRCLQPLPKPTH